MSYTVRFAVRTKEDGYLGLVGRFRCSRIDAPIKSARLWTRWAAADQAGVASKVPYEVIPMIIIEATEEAYGGLGLELPG